MHGCIIFILYFVALAVTLACDRSTMCHSVSFIK